MNPFAAIAGIVLIAIFVFRRVLNKTTGAEGGSGTGNDGGSKVKIDLGNPLEGAGGGAVAGAGAGLAAGPVGALVGAALGAIIGLITEIKPFGSAVRDGIHEWLKKHGDKNDNGNVDGVLMRWALLRIGTVWRGPDGRIAIRVSVAKDDRNGTFGRRVEFEGFNVEISTSSVIRKAAYDISEAIAYSQPASLDPPGAEKKKTAAFKAFRLNARVGDLHEIVAGNGGGPLVPTFPAPPHAPAYTVRKRPRISLTPVADKRGWTAVHVSEGNVDSLCQWWDRAVGADWS